MTSENSTVCATSLEEAIIWVSLQCYAMSHDIHAEVKQGVNEMDKQPVWQLVI